MKYLIIFRLLLCFLILQITVGIQVHEASDAKVEGLPHHRRIKRSGDTMRTFFWFFEKLAIIRKHNEFRTKTHASNMQKMYWDSDLETVARNYASECTWAHNQKRKTQQNVYSTVGENIFYTTGSVAGQTNMFVGWWFSEKADFTFLNNSCKSGRACGHYTQVVWHNTAAVGCGFKFCLQAENIKTKSIYIVVCNYGPAGNFRGQKPYKEGTACSACPTNKQHCDDGLCTVPNCGGKSCKNGGKLITDVCMCDCRKTGGYTGESCEIGGVKTTPKVVKTTPKVVKTTPNVVKTTPKVVKTTPEVVKTTPDVKTSPEQVTSPVNTDGSTTKKTVGRSDHVLANLCLIAMTLVFLLVFK